MADTDLRPTFESALDAFGLDATVTPPGGPAVETRAMWLPPITVDHPGDGLQQRAEPWRRLAIPLSSVPQVPRGTVVAVPEYKGAAVANWKVDDADRLDHDHYRMTVLPA